jgi:signal transduction histidine kinase
MLATAMIRDVEAMGSDRSILAAMIELASTDRGDWEVTIQNILRMEARVLDVERVSFWTVRDEGKTLVCEMAYQRTTGVFERGFTLAVGERFEALLSSEPFASEDCRSDPRVRSFRSYVEARSISSLLAFPVWARGNLAGVLCHEHVGPPRSWSTSDQRFAAVVAQTASAALEARAREKAQEGALRAEFLDQTSRTLSETLEVDEVARRAVALTVQKLGDWADILLVEEDGIRRVAFDHVTAEGRALLAPLLPLQRIVPGGSLYHLKERAIASRDSILLPDISEGYVAELHDPEIASAIRRLGARSLICVLMFVGERIIGIITMATAARRYGIDDLGLAEEFARRVAAAFENAQLHQRLHAAMQSAQAAAQRAKAAVRARDEFIMLAGHELRTPLTALQLTAQKLVRRSSNAPSEDVVRIAGRIVKQLERLERLNAQMLDARRISVHRLPLSRAPTDLAEIARDAAETFEPVLRRGGSPLLVQADAPVVGDWDATQLEQLLSSLLDNAAKFGAGKPVEIAIQREGDDATLSVRDHGQGIPPDRMPHIFEAFERAVSSTHYGGLGLGLFIARAIVEGHGGRLTVDSHPGEGATFTARLPLRAPPEASAASAAR